MEVHRGEDVRVCRLTPGVEEHLRNMGAPVSVVPPEKILFPWTKAAFIVPGPLAEENPQCGDILAWLEENCPGRYDAAPSGAIVDVACAGSTKGTGVLRLLEYLGAGREGLFCAGDGWNDLPMLRLAHRAFAPETALAAVRQEPGLPLPVPPGAACGILWSFWRNCTEKRKQGRPDESIVRAALLFGAGIFRRCYRRLRYPPPREAFCRRQQAAHSRPAWCRGRAAPQRAQNRMLFFRLCRRI